MAEFIDKIHLCICLTKTHQLYTFGFCAHICCLYRMYGYLGLCGFQFKCMTLPIRLIKRYVFDYIKFVFFFCSFKMIGLAQGPGPCDSRRYVNSSETNSPATPLINNFSQIISTNNKNHYNELYLHTTSLSSFRTHTDYEKEVLRLVGPLTAEAPISRSAWSQ